MFNSAQLNDRIKKAASALGVEDVNRVRIIVTLERIVARLVTNQFLKEHLIFGGGFVLFKEFGSDRFTKDADAIINGISKDKLIEEVTKALAIDLEDGFWFGDPAGEELETESGYGGYRFQILYKVGAPYPSFKEKAKLRRVHLDISIGVDLEDVARETKTSSILSSLGSIAWKVYPPEFIASEKIHCLLYRGQYNTRGKDVYDLSSLFKEMDEKNLLIAIERTFKRRSFEVKSLFEVANNIDTSTLKDSYQKVMTEEIAHTFEESWEIILKKLKVLDRMKKG